MKAKHDETPSKWEESEAEAPAAVATAGILVHDDVGAPLWLRAAAIDAWQDTDPTQLGRVRLWLRSGQVLVVAATEAARASIAAAVR